MVSFSKFALQFFMMGLVWNFCYLCEEIQSIGTYSNPGDFHWSLGVPELSFMYQHQCPVNSTDLCQYYWWSSEVNSFRVTFFNGTIEQCESSGYTLPRGITNFTGFCSLKNSSTLWLRSNVTLALNTSVKNFNLSIKIFNQVTELRLLKFSECHELELEDPNVKVEYPMPAIYDSSANCSCNNLESTALSVDGVYNKYRTLHTLTCGYDTKWIGSQNVSCWFAPIAELNILPSSTTLSGKEISLNCSISGGNPSDNITAKYFKNGIGLSETNITVSSGDNQAVFFCQGENQYVTDVDSQSGMSRKVILNVQYKPEERDSGENYNRPVQSASVNETVHLLFQFAANPRVHNVTLLKFYFSTNTSLDISESQLSLGKDNYTSTFNYTIHNIAMRNGGLYTLSVKSPDSTQFPDPLVISTKLTVQNSPAGPHTANLGLIIGCAVAGAILLILIIIMICLMLKRKSPENSAQKDIANAYATSAGHDEREERVNPIYGSANMEEKEDRINPLYGTAPANAIEVTYTSVVKTEKNKGKPEKSHKKEKNNPLYNAATANDNTVEEAYAAVDKRKKKGGNENPVFTLDSSGDTYTEVIKKKKKKTAPTEPDVMYAEVQKQKKKKKADSTAETLHGS